MFKRLLPAIAAATMLAIAGAPALAQQNPALPDPANTNNNGTQADGQDRSITGERVSASRVQSRQRSRDRASAQRADEQQRAQQARQRPSAAAPTPEQAKAAAEALIVSTSATCQVGETVVRGQIENASVYETTCATGPGLILIGSTPPQAIDCVLLAGQAEITRSRDPAADVGLQCQIEANKNVLKVVAEYATAAGVKCAVDQGASVGKSTAGNIIYEVGCPNAEGYWLEKSPTGWTTTECAKVMSSGGTCRFTTAAEQAASLKGWLTGSDAAACDVTEARYMGANANGSFYEAKCAAGDGYIARFDTAMAVQQVYACAVAQPIGGGCKLTTVPAAAAAAPPATR